MSDERDKLIAELQAMWSGPTVFIESWRTIADYILRDRKRVRENVVRHLIAVCAMLADSDGLGEQRDDEFQATIDEIIRKGGKP